MRKPGERSFLQKRQEVMRSPPRFSSLRRRALTTSMLKPGERGFLQELQEVMPSLHRFSSLRHHALATSTTKPGERGLPPGAAKGDAITTSFLITTAPASRDKHAQSLENEVFCQELQEVMIPALSLPRAPPRGSGGESGTWRVPSLRV